MVINGQRGWDTMIHVLGKVDDVVMGSSVLDYEISWSWM